MLQDKRIRNYDLKNIELVLDFTKCDFKKNDFETHLVVKENLVFAYDKDYNLMFVAGSVGRAIKSLKWCIKEYNEYYKKGSEQLC